MSQTCCRAGDDLRGCLPRHRQLKTAPSIHRQMFGLHPPFVHFVATSLIPHCVGPSERARYVGEPVAVIVAKDRYLAEDALALINVHYRPLPAVVDPEAALHENAPVLHTAPIGCIIVASAMAIRNARLRRPHHSGKVALPAREFDTDRALWRHRAKTYDGQTLAVRDLNLR
jgi:CO/xanthine dehydrogenase Mo-binding subunit